MHCSQCITQATATSGSADSLTPTATPHRTNEPSPFLDGYQSSPGLRSTDSRKATAVLTHFRCRMFKGDLSQSIDSTIRDYETCAEQLQLDASQKEYHSDSRQLQVQSNLETLRPAKFMEENDISSVSDGLSKIVDYIERLTPQCPPGYTFNAFVTALRESLQLESEISSSTVSPHSTRMAKIDAISSDREVLLTQYGRNPRFPSNRQRPLRHQDSLRTPAMS
eukprot:IDg682t1